MNKWKSLCRRFDTEIKKVKQSEKSGAGSSQVYRSNWKYYSSLSFIKDHLGPEVTISNLHALFQSKKEIKDEEEEEEDINYSDFDESSDFQVSENLAPSTSAMESPGNVKKNSTTAKKSFVSPTAISMLDGKKNLSWYSMQMMRDTLCIF